MAIESLGNISCSSSSTTVTNQSDVDHGPLSSCGSGNGDLFISVKNATGTLNFTKTATLGLIEVDESPGLEVLDFPQLPQIVASSLDLTLVDFGANDVGSPYEAASNITALLALDTSDCLDLTALESISDFRLTGTPGCSYNLLNLKSNPPSVRANDFMSVTDSVFLEVDNISGGYNHANRIDLDRIDKVGGDLNITSNTNVDITFDGHTSVGSTLYLHNDTKFTFNFKKISQIKELYLLDNIDTVIPVFESLQRAENTHIRGFINTTVGNNLFPALTFVSGNLMVETLNPDFNCSKLVSQYNDGIIHNLACNGTNNGTMDTVSSATLSDGDWAGIGIGSGVILLGLIVVLVWLVLHHIREEIGPPYIGDTGEFDGTGIIREAPDNPLIELPKEDPELPDDPLVELPIGDVELPTRPQTLSSLRSNNKPLLSGPAEEEAERNGWLGLASTDDAAEAGITGSRPGDSLDAFPVGYAELPTHPQSLTEPSTDDEPHPYDSARGRRRRR
ncbi:hypothetical protein F5B21DRAFT_518153 [Xylaria acuta]|nr:hypothetical protein F5B21DRAFT_518153 [Xylaria acuta]